MASSGTDSPDNSHSGQSHDGQRPPLVEELKRMGFMPVDAVLEPAVIQPVGLPSEPIAGEQLSTQPVEAAPAETPAPPPDAAPATAPPAAPPATPSPAAPAAPAQGAAGQPEPRPRLRRLPDLAPRHLREGSGAGRTGLRRRSADSRPRSSMPTTSCTAARLRRLAAGARRCTR